MRLTDMFKLSFSSIVRNKGRAVLTMLGIVIGVASVILMLAAGQSAEKLILSQIASFGSDLIIVRSGPGDGSTGSGPPNTTIKQVLTMKDYKKLKQQSWVLAAGANHFTSVLVEHESYSNTIQVAGTTESEVTIYNTEVGAGEYFTADDVDSAAKVAVLGSDMAKEMFGENDPLGQRIKIRKTSYRVVGVMKPAGTRFFTNLDKQIYIPVTTLMDELGIDKVFYINLKIGSLSPDEAKERIRVLLRDAHNLDNPSGDLAKDDFFIATQEDTMERAGVIGTILEVLLASIAAISLVVGGVGIMNIMFVTVTERTREIGLRKAIGAKKNDVKNQFLTEAIILCLGGGLVGVLFGIGFSYLGIQGIKLAGLGDWAFSVPWDGVTMGLGVSTLIGVVFGYFPAKKAADLNPIEALQYE